MNPKVRKRLVRPSIATLSLALLAVASQAQPASLHPPVQPLVSGGNGGGNAVTAPLYADGSVSCGGADDLSHRAGTVVLRPVAGGIAFHVVLTHAAPDWPYYVELSRNGTCQAPVRFFGFTTGQNGQGVFNGVYPAGAGQHSILVDVVSDAKTLPSDPTHREIAPGELLVVSLPAGDGGILTLGFGGGSGALPWSEQGFTFVGGAVFAPASVVGQALEQVSFGGFFAVNTVALAREGGGVFDAVSLEVGELWACEDAYAWVESDLGGYQDIWPGTNLLVGPEWAGITGLFISVYGVGDGAGLAARLETDDYVVRVPGD